ncbi:Uncharacterised protein [Cedecea neteri]|uniref:Uncharacterized protein n=1 Tax=Cedecea neteri TaxID=158822 RepID=A0A2X3IFS9_9ENTR|nr:Uncharacterised protein [Cedecea neteri]
MPWSNMAATSAWKKTYIHNAFDSEDIVNNKKKPAG